MAINCYLAMTAAEIRHRQLLPEHLGWMACHFSSYGTGLSNLPASLPQNAMLILNDRTPISRHDPERILAQLLALIATNHCGCVLLDFQRPDNLETAALVQVLASGLPCPWAVSEHYATDSGAVFLPPIPMDINPETYLQPWTGREIWLEAALENCVLTLTEDGCTAVPHTDLPPDGLIDRNLHCHYTVTGADRAAMFHLWRTQEDLDTLLCAAESLGVTQAVGLWQELGDR